MNTLSYGPGGQLRHADGRGLNTAAGVSVLQNILGKKRQALTSAVESQVADETGAENREASNRAFQFAQSLATSRRPVGGGLMRGGRMRSLNAATGGLTAANQQARKTTRLKAAHDAFEADDQTIGLRGFITRLQTQAQTANRVY